ncbi:autotransporter-associated beta strand repeat-containing protein [Variovorax sp. M-6]|uniref:autotransporter-associated beta strand repeat-containing protein n=1 Tax=Variovorax sp. M-6 TaxID=3233041 RepID=UPI003F9DBABB
MNCTHRTVWNPSLGAWVAAPETARRRSTSGVRNALALTAAMPLLWIGSAAQAACTPANPTAGATVTCTGAANILAPSYATSANNVTVNVQSGASAGVLLGLGGTAMSLTGNNVTLNNAGTIDPSLLGLLSLLSSGTVVGNGNASTVTIHNSPTGVMNGTSGLMGVSINGLTGMALAVQNGTGGVTNIRNDGSIGANALLGLSMIPSDMPVVASYGGGQTSFVNTGTITGRVAFQAAGTPGLGHWFANSGTINGGVSMGAGSTNTFTAVSGSSVNLAGGIGLDLNVVGLVGATISFAPTGVVDGGAGGNNTLVLQNVLPTSGTGTGTGGALTTLSSGTYINFQHLKVNSGTWNLQGPLVSGDAALNGGLVNFSNAGVFGSGILAASGGAIAASTGGLTLGNNITLGASGLSVAGTNALTLSGVISGVGGLTQNGMGTLTLSGANTYTGGTTIITGALQGDTTSLRGDIVDHATLVFNQNVNGIYNGTLSGTGALVKQGSGTLTLSGNNSYSGTTQIDAGTLALGAGASVASSAGVGLAAGATLDLSAAGNQSIGSLNGGGGTVNIGATTLTISGTGDGAFAGTINGTGALVKNGASTQTLTGANLFTGGTTVNDGVLVLGAGGSLAAGSALKLNGNGVLDVSAAGNQTIATLGGDGGQVRLGGTTLSVGAGTYGGVLAGTGGVNKIGSGTLTLNGVSTYTGPTQVNAGSLIVGGDAAHASASVQGAITVANSGTLSGFGKIDGNVVVQAGGHLAPGNPVGSFTINGNLVAEQGSSLDFAFGTPGANFSTPGQGHHVQVNGNLTINGATLNPSNAGNFGPGLYNLFRYTGTLTESNGGIAPPAGGYTIQNLAGSKQINLITTAGMELNFWNANGLASNSQMGGGSGVWSQANANWTDATGSVTSTRQPSNAFVIFGGAPGTVTVDSAGGARPVSAIGVQFASNGYHLNGDALTLSGAAPSPLGEIRVGDGSAGSVNWTATVDNVLAGAGIHKTGLGTLVLNGANTYTQSTRISRGVLAVSSDANLGAPSASIALEGGTLRITGTAFNTTARAVTLAATGASIDIADAGNNFTLASAMSGTGGLEKLGAGTLTLTGANTYSGGTRVNAGTLALGPGGSLPSTGELKLVGAGARFDFSASGADQTLAVLSGSAGSRLDLGSSTLTFGDSSNQTFAGSIVGSGGLIKQGSGTQILSGVNSYSGGTLLRDGTLAVGHSGALGTGPLAMDDNTTLAFVADGLTLANPIRFTGVVDPIIDTGANTATLSGGISGASELTKQGTGTLILAAANNIYTAATTVSHGTLRAGAANAFSAASAHAVAAGATLDLAGHNQTIAALTNAGTVNLLSAAAGTTLTVTGPYVGNNGVLKMGTTFGGSNSISDRMVLSGPSAVASGHTTLQITHLGGLGAQTTGDGIEVVSAQNGATSTRTAFTLDGDHVDAGAFQYRLFAGDANGQGGSWFLSTQDRSAITTTGTPAPPAAPMYRAEVPLYAALPSVLRQGDLAMLADLHRRVGDESGIAAATAGSADASTSGWGGANRHAWGRVLGGTITVSQGGVTQPESRTSMGGFQSGVDLFANPLWRAGLYAGLLRADANVNGAYGPGGLVGYAGTLHADSTYVGGYATYADPQGLYADFVLQHGNHDVSGGSLGQGSSFGATSLMASGEIGQRFALGGGWALEPQAQLIYHRLSLDNTRISGASVLQDADNAVIGRIGARLAGDLSTSMGRLRPYAGINLWHGFSGHDTVTFAGPAGATPIESAVGYTSTELMVGFTLGLTPKVSVYGQLGRVFRTGSGDAQVRSTAQGTLGLNLMF